MRARPSVGIWLAGFALLLLVMSGPARAAEGSLNVALSYAVSPGLRGCGDKAEFRRSVAARLGHDPFRQGAAFEVDVRVDGTAQAIAGHIDWRTAGGTAMGERRFFVRDGNCGKLLAEMSFTVSLQIELLRPGSPKADGAAAAPDKSAAPISPLSVESSASPSATATAPASAASPPPSPPAPARTDLPEPPASGRTSDRPPEELPGAPTAAPSPLLPSRWSLSAGLGPALAWRLGPTLTGDARLFLAIRRNNIALEVAAEASYPSTQRRWDGSGFRQSLIGGTLALCGYGGTLLACALARASELRVSGLGVDHAISSSRIIAQAGLRLGASVGLFGPWHLALHLDGLALLTPATVQLDRAPVWTMPGLAGLAGLDLSFRFE